MNIHYILNSGKPGGMEYHVLDLVQGMVKRGHKVHVWCTEGKMFEDYKSAGAFVEVHKIGLEIDPLYILKLATYLRKNKIDVLHAHELKAVANSLLAGFLARTKVKVSHVHTPISEWKIPSLLKKINVLVNSLLINLFSSCEIALTESRKKVKEKEGIKSSKLSIIPNGINVEEFDMPYSKKIEYRKEILNRYNIDPKSIVIGNVSRMSEEKGHQILIDAFALLLQYAQIEKEHLHLFLAGGGILESSLKEYISSLELQNQVTITGVFESDDLLKFYSTFDIYAFPTLAEGFGLVMMEAMASKVPIVCSDLPVLQEVAGSTVLYAETGNAQSFAERLNYLYSKRSSLDNLTEGAFIRVKELYSLESFNTNYEQLYTRLLEGN